MKLYTVLNHARHPVGVVKARNLTLAYFKALRIFRSTNHTVRLQRN